MSKSNFHKLILAFKKSCINYWVFTLPLIWQIRPEASRVDTIFKSKDCSVMGSWSQTTDVFRPIWVWHSRPPQHCSNVIWGPWYWGRGQSHRGRDPIIGLNSQRDWGLFSRKLPWSYYNYVFRRPLWLCMPSVEAWASQKAVTENQVRHAWTRRLR